MDLYISGFLVGSFHHEQSQLQSLFGFYMGLGLGLDRMNKSREADLGSITEISQRRINVEAQMLASPATSWQQN